MYLRIIPSIFQVTQQCKSFVWKPEAANDKVNFSLYYETLCPYCRQFITNQLSRAYDNILDIINITIIPYGNAHEIFDTTSQTYKFTCQHGPDECVGNLIHVKIHSRVLLIKPNFFAFRAAFSITIQQLKNIL